MSSEHSAIVEGLYSLAVEFENDGMPRNANVIRDLAVRTCLALARPTAESQDDARDADTKLLDELEVFVRERDEATICHIIDDDEPRAYALDDPYHVECFARGMTLRTALHEGMRAARARDGETGGATT